MTRTAARAARARRRPCTMKVAVISDIHANRQAFEATLEAVAASDAAELWCLGDLVGYGADPDACVELAREHAAVCLAGNHDLAVTGEIPLDEFSRGASLAAQWTREVIAPENLEFLAEPAARRARRPASASTTPARATPSGSTCSRRCWPSCASTPRPHRVCLIGHSHVALSFVRREGELATGEPRREGTALDIAEGEWLLNPGSVGQPRDGDPRASWLLLDLDGLTRVVPAHRLRRRRAPPPRSAPRACPTRSPSAWSTVSDDARPATAATSARGGETRRAQLRCARPAAAAGRARGRPRRARGRADLVRELGQGADPGGRRRAAAGRLRSRRAGRRKRRRQLHGDRKRAAEDRTGLRGAAAERRQRACATRCARASRTCARARSRCARSRCRRRPRRRRRRRRARPRTDDDADRNRRRRRPTTQPTTPTTSGPGRRHAGARRRRRRRKPGPGKGEGGGKGHKERGAGRRERRAAQEAGK